MLETVKLKLDEALVPRHLADSNLGRVFLFGPFLLLLLCGDLLCTGLVGLLLCAGLVGLLLCGAFLILLF